MEKSCISNLSFFSKKNLEENKYRRYKYKMLRNSQAFSRFLRNEHRIEKANEFPYKKTNGLISRRRKKCFTHTFSTTYNISSGPGI